MAPVIVGGGGSRKRASAIPEAVPKRRRTEQSAQGSAAAAVSTASATTSATAATAVPGVDLRGRFLAVLSDSKYQVNGISNGQLKEKFKTEYPQLAPIINALTQESRLTMSQVPGTGELSYVLQSSEQASKFEGLDRNTRMVYSVIERAGNMGLWTKDVRLQTNIQQQALNKIFKTLENRRLIKPVKSVTAKAKKLYMLYDLIPSKELTGGVWYSDLEFDHEFISELRNFIMHCVRRLNGGRGVTVADIQHTLIEKNVSKINLSEEEMEQLVQTLTYDYMIEECGENEQGEPLYTAAKRVSTMCEFKWWDALEPDFHFRQVVFEDGVVLDAHEPHYQT
jgi:DNA-directed RNA polymerase III subunit RPC6